MRRENVVAIDVDFDRSYDMMKAVCITIIMAYESASLPQRRGDGNIIYVAQSHVLNMH